MNRFVSLCALTLVLLAPAAAQTRRPATAAPPATPATRRAAPATQPATTRPAPAATPTPRTATAAPSAAPAASPASAADGLPAVLATVNGVQLTRADLSPEVEQRVLELQQNVVEARKRELDLQINSRLLDAEAKRRGVTAVKLLQDEVLTKVAQPTPAEVRAFFDQNRSRFPAAAAPAPTPAAGSPPAAATDPNTVVFESFKDQIVEYLVLQRQRELAKALADRLRAAAQVKVLVTEVTPPTTAAERERVFATVNGQPVTSGDVEDAILPLVAETQDQAYKMRMSDLNLHINDILLQQEAQKLQLTPRALLDQQIATRAQPVTEAEAQTFYNQNKERINGQYAQIKEQLMQYLKEQREEQATGAYANQLRGAARIQTFLTPPVPPVYNITTDDQPARGNQQARVTLIEFTDFQCPSCAAQHPILERLMTEYGDRVRLVVRDFPLVQHKSAVKAAEAAEAAREQGKYWEYAALLFRQQEAATTDEAKEAALAVPKLKEYATQVGLDRTKFDAALDSGRFNEKVLRDQQDGLRFGVNATPSLFVNGRRIADHTYEGLKAALDAALRQSASTRPTP